MKGVAAALPHAQIVLSGMLIVFVILERFNPSMGYLTNDVTLILLMKIVKPKLINNTPHLGCFKVGCYTCNSSVCTGKSKGYEFSEDENC